MPLICHVCRDDINSQQQSAQAQLEQNIDIARQADLASAHLLDAYNPINLLPDHDKLGNDEQAGHDELVNEEEGEELMNVERNGGPDMNFKDMAFSG